MNPREFLEAGTVTVAEPTYAVCRTDEPHSEAFATVQTDSETTVVVDEHSTIAEDAADVEPGWKRLTFEMDLPFDLVGFLSAVATALAEADVSVFVISAYSTDHVLVKQDDLEIAIESLESLGCTVQSS